MRIISKTIKSKKKSIISLFLAAVLMLSFNYAPISVITNNILSASAYKSENVQTYYPSSQVGTESNMSSGNYPSSLAEYFANSSNNFNILTYYNSRFADLFAKYVDEYLDQKDTGSQITVGGIGRKYNEVLVFFLSSNSSTSLSEYYTKNATRLNSTHNVSDFKSYIEYFMSHSTSFTYSGETITLPALYKVSSSNGTQHLSEFYNDLAYVIYHKYNAEGKDDIDQIVDVVDGKYDGLKSDSDFYTDSIAYNHVKNFIDKEIEKTVAIYTYDGKTQNKNVAGIFANNAPTERSYYYKDNTFATLDLPNEPFETKSVSTAINPNGRANVIYYFGEHTSGSSDITNTQEYKDNRERFSILSISERNKNILSYRIIRPEEDGYIAGYTTYYRYTNVPYEVLSGTLYQLYILDDDVDVNEKATYDSLYITPITSKELEADEDRLTDLNKSGRYYIQVPYSSGTDGELYFRTIFGLNANSQSTTTFNNFVKYCTDSLGNSKLYFKLQPSSTRVVYVLGTQSDADAINATSYRYTVKPLSKSDYNKNPNDYFKITSSYSDYYNDKYQLYFEKIRVDYTELDTSDAAYEKESDGTIKYETQAKPNIPYETMSVPSNSYVTSNDERSIYVLVGNDVTDSTVNGFPTIKQSDLENRNLYVKVPSSIIESKNLDKNYDYYFKHETKTVNKIYIIDDASNAKNNEVYKNLNYEVIKTSEYNDDFSSFIAISSNDPNYNKNFKLYYKYDFNSFESGNNNLYVKNLLRENTSSSTNTNKNAENAIFIIDDSLTASDRTNYKNLNYTVITTSEYNANSAYYVQIAENDPNYSKTYTKLYYKYNESATTAPERVPYLYSSSASATYKTFYRTDAGYIADDYELIPAGDPGYVEGLELYYKKIRNVNAPEKVIEQNTYYYYQTNSSISLKAKSFYMISFYLFTKNADDNAEASVYITDTSGVISDIKLEGINTHGKWQKYCIFIATDSLATSSINIKLYMGDESSIAGSTYSKGSTVSSVVLFDDIKITKINETDFNNRSVDDVATPSEDEFKNKIIIANETFTNVYDNRTKTDVSINDGVNNNLTFENIVDFDHKTSYDVSLLLNNMNDNFDANADGYSPLTQIWQYYISRDVSGQGNEYLLSTYRDAYKNGNVNVEIIEEESIFDKKEVKTDDEEKDDDKDEDKKDDDIKFVKNTFNSNNKILKIENTNRLLSLGIISNNFTLRQSMYYKITVWVYSPDKDAKAVVGLNSYLKTNSTTSNSSTLSVAATVDANISAYTTAPTNEYGWIPVTLFVEGNALHSQDCNLVLCADKSSTVYFDNITIETTTSASYDTANSDSDTTTHCLSLTPSSSVITAGITNGYFNNVNVTNNYKTIDNSLPRTAKNWTVESTNSSNVIAGVVPTSSEYLALSDNFYKKYGVAVPSTTIPTNVYAIHAPTTISGSIHDADKTSNSTSVYKFYSSSISLSASTVYKVSFQFAKASDFKSTYPGIEPRMVANIYNKSVASDNIISSFAVEANTIDGTDWQTYTFYIATGTSSASIYLELGVENATGTCFFQKASSKTTTDSLDKIRDELLTVSNDKYQVETIKNSRFINLADSKFSMITSDKNENGIYDSKDYTIDSTETSDYTTGKSGVVIADYYTLDIDYKYTVTIDKVEYYMKEIKDESTGEITYKLYSDSNYKNEVTKIGGKAVVINSNNVITVGTGSSATEYTTTKTEIRNYVYSFDKDTSDDMVVINNVFIPKSELKNSHSQNVLVLANSYSTDYTIATPSFNNSLKTSAYYALKIYVKTSNFDTENFGLNIAVNALSTTWTNINTTNVSSNKDENGFVCYQILITSNKSSISNLSVSFSLGSKSQTGTGYALISGVELQTFATEKLFNEYAENFDSNETTTKKYFGKTDNSNNNGSSNSNDQATVWATFFYVFSSILLGLALISALVAVIIKKHPIKISKTAQNDHERDSILVSTENDEETQKSSKGIKRTRKISSKSKPKGNDEGFV